MAPIKFKTYGNAKHPAIILLHAFPLDGAMWSEQIAVLKENYYVVVPDMRGFGNSKENVFVISTMDSYAMDILELMNALGLEKVIMCGLSIGGYIIFRCLALFPDKILKIILANTKSGKDDDKALLNRAASIAKLQAGEKEDFVDKLVKQLVCQNTVENKPAVINDLLEIMQRQTAEAMILGTAAMAMRVNSESYLSTYNIPALIIAGREDRIIPLEASHILRDKIQGAVLSIIKNAGHLSNLENPADFNLALKDFLG